MNLIKHMSVCVSAVVGLSMISVGVQAQAGSSPADSRPAESSTDGDLSRVKQALHSNHSLDDKHINVSMQGGKVILRGFVTSQRDLEAAVRVAKQAVGEGKVVNELTIKQPAESNGSG